MKNVLIVDDNSLILFSLTEYLKSENRDFNILTARNGREAVEVIESSDIDILITDINMPEMNGLALLAYMYENHPGVPVIAMTASAEEEVAEGLRSLGITELISKPFDIRDINEGIRILKGYLSDSDKGGDGTKDR